MKKSELKTINTLLSLGRGRPDIDRALDVMTDSLTGLSGVKGMILYLEGPDGRYFLASESGPDDRPPSPAFLDESPALAQQFGRLSGAERLKDPGALHPAWKDYQALVSIPFRFGGRKGLGFFFTASGEKSSGPGLPFFNLLGDTLGLLCDDLAEADHLADENVKRVRELSILYDISMLLAGTRSVDEILRMILTAATIGHGLGFNRAGLFLINENTGILQGMMGVGPRNAEEASHIWAELTREGWDLSEALKYARETPVNALDEAIKSIRIPLEPEAGILALSAIHRRPYNITDAANDPRVNQEMAGRLGSGAFAVAPLLAEGQVLGVIAVDNRYNSRPISDDDLRLLSTFTGQASLALYNAQLYNRLENATRERQSLYRRLTRSERLAALGEMAATIAHEVRNPLVSIGGFTRRMEKRLEANDPNRKFTEIIIKELTRLENFLNEVLVFSRELMPRFQKMDLNRVVAQTADFFSGELKKKMISLELDLSGDLPTITADPEQTAQVLMNLFNNSMDAMESGGRVSIRTSASPHHDSVTMEFYDRGGGIPEDVLPDIFNPFYTTKNKGTGLGLALIQKIVHGHGGFVEVRNEPGESVTFLMRLPVKQETLLEGTILKEAEK